MSRSSNKHGDFRSRINTLGFSGSNILAIAGVTAFRGSKGNVFIRCPGHDDTYPNCSIHLETGKGNCFACGWKCGDVVALYADLRGLASQIEALQELEGLAGCAIPTLSIERMPTSRGKTRGRSDRTKEVLQATWTYTTADNTPAFSVLRFARVDSDGQPILHERTGKPLKSFSQRHPDGTPGLPAAFKSGLRPMYRLPMLLGPRADEAVIVVEGEKAADALIDRGACATTSSGGASQAHHTDWAPLAGRTVLLWPDNDKAGRRHMAEVAARLKALKPGTRVLWVRIEGMGLPPGGDAADFLERASS